MTGHSSCGMSDAPNWGVPRRTARPSWPHTDLCSFRKRVQGAEEWLAEPPACAGLARAPSPRETLQPWQASPGQRLCGVGTFPGLLSTRLQSAAALQAPLPSLEGAIALSSHSRLVEVTELKEVRERLSDPWAEPGRRSSKSSRYWGL